MPAVDLVYFPGCPNVEVARAQIKRALTAVGVALTWNEHDSTAVDAPAWLRGLGSPTILVDGVDVSGHAPPSDAGASCRVYAGGEGAPSLALLVTALRASLERASSTPDPRLRSQLWATGGVMGASLLIASCCLGPTLFLLFGVSITALARLSVLDLYRPWLIAGGAAALGYALWGAWRPRNAGSDPSCGGETCVPSPQRRRLRAWTVVAALFYAAAIVYPWILNAVL